MDLTSQYRSLVDSDGEQKVETDAVASVIDVDATSMFSEGGLVVICGSTDWANAAKGTAGKIKQKSSGAKFEEFNSPTVVGGLLKQRVARLGVGPCAAHCAAITGDGRLFLWGLNKSGQLGLGPGGPSVVLGPTEASLWAEAVAEGKKKKPKARKVAVGKNHTVVSFESGAVASAGCGSRGALGRGERKADLAEVCPKPGHVTGLAGRDVVELAAGADFSLCVDSSGSLYSFGWTEFGKLGQGSDGCYNTKDSSIKLTYTASGSPTRVAMPRVSSDSSDAPQSPRIVVQCSAGKNHAACVCDDGVAYTWGDGAYGKLGHRSQEQLTRPTPVEGARFNVVYCGDNSTCGLGWPEYRGRPFVKPPNSDGVLYVWGCLKGTQGEGATHPVPEYELQGWGIKPANLAMGASHLALAADDAAVAWAQMPVAHSQLGFGPKGPKSSHKPKKLDALDGAKCAQVVAATGTTHYLIDASDAKLVESLPVWTPAASVAEDDDEEVDEEPVDKRKKKKKPSSKKPASKKSRTS